MGRILGLGGVTYDILTVLDDNVGWDETVFIEKPVFQQGGMAATAIVAARKLGADAEFVGAVGDDDSRLFHIENFSKYGVGTDQLATVAGASSALTIVLVNKKNGQRSFLHHKGISAARRLPGDRDIDIEGVSHILLDGFYFETALEMARDARKNGITTVTDFSSGKTGTQGEILEYLGLIDYPVLSSLLACPFTGLNDPLEAGKTLYKKTNKALIVTFGEVGAYVITDGGTCHIPTFQVDTVDTTGAGDVFHGAFMFGIWKGYSISDSVKIANASSSLKCMKVGGQQGIPDFDQVIDFLAKNNIEIKKK